MRQGLLRDGLIIQIQTVEGSVTVDNFAGLR